MMRLLSSENILLATLKQLKKYINTTGIPTIDFEECHENPELIAVIRDKLSDMILLKLGSDFSFDSDLPKITA